MASLGFAIVHQYERGVVFRLGKLRKKVRGPGLKVMIPLVDNMRKVSLRTVTMPIESQQVITRDSVSIGLAAVAYYRRIDPVKSIIEIEDVESAIYEIAPTTVRNVVGQSTLDRVLSETEHLNKVIQEVLESTTQRWGVDVQLWSSRTSSSPHRCSVQWRKRPRPSARSGPRSLLPRVRRLAPANWAKPLTPSPLIRSPSSSAIFRSWPRSRSRRTRRSSSPRRSWTQFAQYRSSSPRSARGLPRRRRRRASRAVRNCSNAPAFSLSCGCG